MLLKCHFTTGRSVPLELIKRAVAAQSKPLGTAEEPISIGPRFGRDHAGLLTPSNVTATDAESPPKSTGSVPSPRSNIPPFVLNVLKYHPVSLRHTATTRAVRLKLTSPDYPVDASSSRVMVIGAPLWAGQR